MSSIENQPRRPFSHAAAGARHARRPTGRAPRASGSSSRPARRSRPCACPESRPPGSTRRRRSADIRPYHRRLQHQRRARWRVFLGRVMRLVDPRADVGCAANRRAASSTTARKIAIADREVRRSQHAQTGLGRELAQRRLVACHPVVPITTLIFRRGQLWQVRDHGVRQREVDGDIHGPKSPDDDRSGGDVSVTMPATSQPCAAPATRRAGPCDRDRSGAASDLHRGQETSRKEPLMPRAGARFEVCLVNHERDVSPRGCLRDHPDRARHRRPPANGRQTPDRSAGPRRPRR